LSVGFYKKAWKRTGIGKTQMEALASNQAATCYEMKCYESSLHEELAQMFSVCKLQDRAKLQ
jgi:hypothetical protein